MTNHLVLGAALVLLVNSAVTGLNQPGLQNSTASKQTRKNAYCGIICQSGLPHTMCRYSAGPGSQCSNGQSWPLSPKERVAVLHEHNLLRNKMAAGGIAPFPAAANMKEMEWDLELEEIAQRWADQCSFSHDSCRDTDRFVVGQNVAVYFSSNAKFPPLENRVRSWYDEIKDYRYSPGPFKFSIATGHFTQIVWGDTWLVGCARSRYIGSNQFPTQLFVCNYGPGGNKEGEPLYQKGSPCSGCRSRRCSPTYPALCPASADDLQAEKEPLPPVVLTNDAPIAPEVTFRDFSPSPAPFVSTSTAKATTAPPPIPPSSPSCPRPAGPGPSCTGYINAALSKPEKDAILKRHNDYRSKLASGQQPPFAAAASMLEMVWDEELAKVAQSWADQCSFGYDECAATDLFRLGQNLAIWYSQDVSLFPSPENRVDGWFAEHTNYNKSDGSFTFSPSTAAFSQLAWQDSWLLGCGRSRYSAGQVLSELLVCNYGPGGNLLGTPMYSAGSPCSRCISGCSKRFPGLCSAKPRNAST